MPGLHRDITTWDEVELNVVRPKHTCADLGSLYVDRSHVNVGWFRPCVFPRQ